GRAHAALGHAVRAAEVQFDRVAAGVLDRRKYTFPRILVARHHQRNDHRAIRPVALDLADLVEVDLQRAVGDQFDVVETGDALAVPRHRAVTRTDVDDRRIEAKRLPDHAAPAGLERAIDVIGLVGRRRRGEPERVRRTDADEVTGKIGHRQPPPFRETRCRSARSIEAAARLPSSTAWTVKSCLLPTQSPPAQTWGRDV